MNISRVRPWIAIAWVVAVLCFAGYVTAQLRSGKIDVNIMALLPEAPRSPEATAAVNSAIKTLDKQVVWLVTAPDGPPSPAAAAWWVENMRGTGIFTSVQGAIEPADQEVFARHFFEYREHRFSDNLWTQFNEDPDEWARWVLAEVYSPFAGVTASELNHDPLLLTRLLSRRNQRPGDNITMDNGWLIATGPDGSTHFVITAELAIGSFDVVSVERAYELINDAREAFDAQWPDHRILQRGTLFYSYHTAMTTRHEMGMLGLAATLGVIVLVVSFFRSIRPLLLTIFSVATGAICGLFATLIIFGSVHLVTMLLALGVVGVALDYALHFLVERRAHGNNETAWQSLRRLIPAMTMAVATTVLAYFVMLVSPFPGIRQLAVCAGTSLIGAFVTVTVVLPYLSGSMPGDGSVSERMLQRASTTLFHIRRMRFGRWVIVICCALLGIIGIIRFEADDDIGHLQHLPAALQHNEQMIAAITGQRTDQTWFVVFADDPQDTLRRTENLEPHLARALENKAISGFYLLTSHLPSRAQQIENVRRAKNVSAQVAARLRDAGLPVQEGPPKAVPVTRFLTPENGLANPAAFAWRRLWMPSDSGQYAVAVPVFGVINDDSMRAIAERLDGVEWVNRRTEISGVFASQRKQLMWLIVVALVSVGLALSIKYGPLHAIKHLGPIILAVGLAIAALSLTNTPFNLFAVLGLVLLIGIGIDYTLFFANRSVPADTALVAIVLSALTTLLTFGMLAISSIPAVSSFGIVVSVGVVAACLLAPICHHSRL